eukprot:Gb_12480 [translate_table: standard]
MQIIFVCQSIYLFLSASRFKRKKNKKYFGSFSELLRKLFTGSSFRKALLFRF